MLTIGQRKSFMWKDSVGAPHLALWHCVVGTVTISVV